MALRCFPQTGDAVSGQRRGTMTAVLSSVVCLLLAFSVDAQNSSTISGTIRDRVGNAVIDAAVTIRNADTHAVRETKTGSSGSYFVSYLPPGPYAVEVRSHGFRTQIVQNVALDVGSSQIHDFELDVGQIFEQVVVEARNQLIDNGGISVGQVVDERTTRELPLNGRFFIDLALLIPGSVTPPQNGFSTVPIRGSGSFAMQTAGNREDASNYLVNGITLNNQWFGSINFQLPLSSIQEFKIDNSSLSSEYGQNSGGVVRIATRSGTNKYHGELFEFFRNDTLDARNYFEFTSSEPAPFKRNQFGASVGGPLIKERTFFFFAYEGLRQRQGLTMNSLVLSDDQRASASDGIVARLLQFIPRSNFIDSSGTARFIGSASATVDLDSWSGDITHELTPSDLLHGFYFIQNRRFREPTRFGNTVPGFGTTHRSIRQMFTINETHIFSPSLVNEARLGFNRIDGADDAIARLDPSAFGIRNGINVLSALPQITVAGGLNFGGPAGFPTTRDDTNTVVADTASYLRGRHLLKFGGEFRQFVAKTNRIGTGTFHFPTIADFLAGTANSFTVISGDQSGIIKQRALGFFVQETFRLRSDLTIELGVRYDWNITPVERFDRFVSFDPATASLLRVGEHIDQVYKQNDKNFQPRVGVAWDPSGDGKTSVRAAYAVLTDEPLTSVVRPGNPPFASPLGFSGPVRFDNAIDLAQAAGLAPMLVSPDFDNSYLQSWNLNVQRVLMPSLAVMVGYFGSKGTHLTLRRNINQPVNGVRPFAELSDSSPLLPGAPLGNMIQAEGTGNSSYNALWVSLNRPLSRGLQFNVAYTWSKSLDNNSLSFTGMAFQNSYDVHNDRGLSDFDVRHRLAINALYELPFRGNWLIEGWQVAAIIQSQTGNPVNIVTANSTLNGVPGTVRPDVIGPITVLGQQERWFDTSVFVPADRFGNLGRNAVTGPGFNNTDISVSKRIEFREDTYAQLRVDVFDLFNQANFGQPGNVVGTPGFGRITSTRFPTGESGSSRQVQLGLRLVF